MTYYDTGEPAFRWRGVGHLCSALMAALPAPWDCFACAVVLVVYGLVMAVVIPSRNVYRSLGWPPLLFLWFLWGWGWSVSASGWATLQVERKNLDDAYAISRGGLSILGKAKRIVQFAFVSRLEWAAGKFVVGANVVLWTWLVAVLWAWWLVVLPAVGFCWQVLRERRGWWEKL